MSPASFSPLASLLITLVLGFAPPQAVLAQGPNSGSPADPPVDPPAPRLGPGTAPDATQPEPAAREAAAKEAFDHGLSAVSRGDYSDAVISFRRAYEFRPHPVALFNLALALEKAERLPEAWTVFDTLVDAVESKAETREIRRHMSAIAADIAILEVASTAAPTRLCIDGLDILERGPTHRQIALEPGVHQLQIDDRQLSVRLGPGERRVVLLDPETARPQVPSKTRGLPASIGVGIGAGALAVGLGAAALTPTLPAPQRRGLGMGAVGSAGVALTASVIAIILERRSARRGSSADRAARGTSESAQTNGRSRTTLPCPGSPALERRIDIELDLGRGEGESPAFKSVR